MPKYKYEIVKKNPKCDTQGCHYGALGRAKSGKAFCGGCLDKLERDDPDFSCGLESIEPTKSRFFIQQIRL